MNYPTLTSLALMTTFVGAAPVAFAQTPAENMAKAGELRVLVHEAAASACMIDAGVAADVEMQTLAATHRKFTEALSELNGTDVAQFTATIEAKWMPFDEAISMILAGDDPTGYIDNMNRAKGALEFAVLSLHDHTSITYQATADISMSDMLTLDLAERQEVIIQQMKLMACEMSSPTVSADTRDALQDTIAVYETSLAALTDGVPEIGIAAPESYLTQQVLAASAYDWQGMKPSLEAIVEARTATRAQLSGLRWRVNGLDARTADLVDIYLAPVVAEDKSRVALLDSATQ